MCYLDLFSICREKEASVSDLMQSTNERYSFGMSISQEPCRIGSWSLSQISWMCLWCISIRKWVIDLFGVCWVMLKTVDELLACWLGCFRHHQNGQLWIATLHCLMWCIWRERNNRNFEDIERTMPISSYFSLELCWIRCRFYLVCLMLHYWYDKFM